MKMRNHEPVVIPDAGHSGERRSTADDMKGWALVKVMDDRCSRQTIVTRCTLYQQYTTQEALEEAAKSYGGLTDTPYLSPR